MSQSSKNAKNGLAPERPENINAIKSYQKYTQT